MPPPSWRGREMTSNEGRSRDEASESNIPSMVKDGSNASRLALLDRSLDGDLESLESLRVSIAASSARKRHAICQLEALCADLQSRCGIQHATLSELATCVELFLQAMQCPDRSEDS